MTVVSNKHIKVEKKKEFENFSSLTLKQTTNLTDMNFFFFFFF